MVEHHLAKVGVVSEPAVRLESAAGVAELADAQDLKSCDYNDRTGFDSGPRHSNNEHPSSTDRVPDYESGGLEVWLL